MASNDGYETVTKAYDLSGLTLEPEPDDTEENNTDSNSDPDPEQDNT